MYQDHSSERMVRILRVQQGELSVRQAVEKYGVPRSTLQDKVANAQGGQALLTAKEEKHLAYISSLAVPQLAMPNFTKMSST